MGATRETLRAVVRTALQALPRMAAETSILEVK
jgi:hypothetical protein